MREIEERFTRSELVIVAWRSQEQHFNFKKESSEAPGKTKKGGKRKMIYGPNDIGPDGMPDEFFNEDGEIDLRQVSGEQARRYFESRLGIPMPPNVVTKIRDQSAQSSVIREAYHIDAERPVVGHKKSKG